MATSYDAFIELPVHQLQYVAGGEGAAGPGADTNAFGRCGPGAKWTWLGNVYTPACAAHDTAVRTSLANGSSHVMAHVKALPLLPRAIGSYLRARF